MNIGTIIIPLTVLYILGIKIGGIFAVDMFLTLPSETSMRIYRIFINYYKNQGSFLILSFLTLLFFIKYVFSNNTFFL